MLTGLAMLRQAPVFASQGLPPPMAHVKVRDRLELQCGRGSLESGAITDVNFFFFYGAPV